MTEFLLFCLASVGTTLIVARGAIFAPLRDFLANESVRLQRRREKKNLPPSFSLIEFLNGLMSCVQCTGFWCGLFCGCFLVSSDGFWAGLDGLGLRQTVNRVLMLFCCGAAGSFLAPLGDVLLEWLFLSKTLMVRHLEDIDRHVAEHEAAQEANGQEPSNGMQHSPDEAAAE